MMTETGRQKRKRLTSRNDIWLKKLRRYWRRLGRAFEDGDEFFFFFFFIAMSSPGGRVVDNTNHTCLGGRFHHNRLFFSRKALVDVDWQRSWLDDWHIGWHIGWHNILTNSDINQVIIGLHSHVFQRNLISSIQERKDDG